MVCQSVSLVHLELMQVSRQVLWIGPATAGTGADDPEALMHGRQWLESVLPARGI